MKKFRPVLLLFVLAIGVAYWFVFVQIVLEETNQKVARLEEQLQKRIDEGKQASKKIQLLESKIQKLQEERDGIDILLKKTQQKQEQQHESRKQTGTARRSTGYPASLDRLVHASATVDRHELHELLDLGVPLDDVDTRHPNEDALVLYPTKETLPKNYYDASSIESNNHHPKFNATAATENCMSVKLILQQPEHRRKQCLIVMPQWESYHIYKYMRLETDDKLPKPENKDLPLRHVSISHNSEGRFTGVPKSDRHIMPFYKSLINYIQNMDRIQNLIKPMLKTFNSQTIIVSVCNYGQSQLLHNFICNARAKGLDPSSSIFLFATDIKTYQLAKSLNVTVFYDEAIFGSIPEKAAGFYGDLTFAKLMMVKLYAVHLIMHSGYNVLFQDVDIIWYRNPVSWLENFASSNNWDMLFQDDGSRSMRYAPYSPNSGFYFIQNNAMTIYALEMVLRHGDYIMKIASHQETLATVLNDHAMWKGLRIKTFKTGQTTLFPGGKEFNSVNGDFMKKWITSPPEKKSYIFHMSWTLNETIKKNYFKQIGEWYIDSECYSRQGNNNCSHYCLARPNITCHYRDKPSYGYCGNSPSLQPKRVSFWRDQKEIDDLRQKHK